MGGELWYERHLAQHALVDKGLYRPHIVAQKGRQPLDRIDFRPPRIDCFHRTHARLPCAPQPVGHIKRGRREPGQARRQPAHGLLPGFLSRGGWSLR